VPSPWSIAPSLDDLDVARAHDAVVGDGTPVSGVRRLVEESWQRSLQLHVDPDALRGIAEFSDEDLREYRSQHPLSLVLPTIHHLLIRHSFESGLIVAVGDHAGRLLWIDGDRTLRRKAEGMLFVEGADWSEGAVGTSAPGTALALNHGIQISRSEHFNRIVHPWSCTAVPVHDPATGGVLGVIDITGGDDAVAPATLPLIEAAVAAVEAELRIRRLDEAIAPRTASSPRRRAVLGETLLSVLGREDGKLDVGERSIELSARHSEILALLSWHRDGLSAEQLARLVYGRHDNLVTLRAEMVRLRRILVALDATLAPESRPYRLRRPVELDAHRVLTFLDKGAHRVALAAYTGRVMPTSQAPGIRAIGDEVSGRLRESLLADASVDTLLAYARTDDAAYDIDVWKTVLRLLPARSPKRAAVVSRIERIDAELGRN
jgi:transcriptional regulator of acetoin/glycerol metabolism